MDEVTCVIKSFKRPYALESLYNSIRSFYPEIKIVVVDDSGTEKFMTDSMAKKTGEDSNIVIKQTEFDIGLSAGRNLGLSLTETEYFVLLDDDFIFLEDTKIGRFVEAIKSSNCDIVGGRLNEKGQTRALSTVMNIKDGVLYDKTGFHDCENGVYIVDKVYNFFIGNTKNVLTKNKWDENLKLCEHNEFFLRAKFEKTLKVGFIPDVVIGHSIARDPIYNQYRSRGTSYLDYTAKKYGYKDWKKLY